LRISLTGRFEHGHVGERVGASDLFEVFDAHA
jgi:hypothetical protein